MDQAIATETFRKILIADDGTPWGARATELGLGLAAKLEASVVMLGIVEPPNIQAAGEGLPVEDPSNRRRRIEKRLYECIRSGGLLGLEMTTEMVEGWAEKQIRLRARENHVDLIVIGRLPRNWIQRWFTSSVAETLARRTGCSVLSAQ
jgi:nucleotide-binding universal stress UspA family protein